MSEQKVALLARNKFLSRWKPKEVHVGTGDCVSCDFVNDFWRMLKAERKAAAKRGMRRGVTEFLR